MALKRKIGPKTGMYRWVQTTLDPNQPEATDKVFAEISRDFNLDAILEGVTAFSRKVLKDYGVEFTHDPPGDGRVSVAGD